MCVYINSHICKEILEVSYRIICCIRCLVRIEYSQSHRCTHTFSFMLPTSLHLTAIHMHDLIVNVKEHQGSKDSVKIKEITVTAADASKGSVFCFLDCVQCTTLSLLITLTSNSYLVAAVC